jgi:predicted Zn-dependent protease
LAQGDLTTKIFKVELCLLIVFIAICSGEDASMTYDSLGSKLYSARNYTEALNYFNLSLKQDSSNVDAWVHKGDLLKALWKINASLESYNQAVKYDGKNVAAWSGLADGYANREDYANASDAAAKVTEFEGKKENWLREGKLLQMQGLFKDAEFKLDGALKFDPNYEDALYRKALSRIVSNNSTGGEELLNQIIALNPMYKYAYNARGQSLEIQGRYVDALASYNKALELDPKWSLALNNKMHALLALNKMSSAMDIFVRI